MNITLTFLTGSLLGLVLGALLCVRLVSQEVTGKLGPRLRQIEGQLNVIEAEVTYAVSTRHAEIHALPVQEPRRHDR